MKQVIVIHARSDLEQLSTPAGELREDHFIYMNLDCKSPIHLARVHPGAPDQAPHRRALGSPSREASAA
jgi:hypothetical protein